jgi:uncharacterized protein
MRIGIFGDTHDHLLATERALDAFGEAGVEAVIHTGDFVAPFALKYILGRLKEGAEGMPLVAVFGNNDGERRGLSQLLPDLRDGPRHIELGGRKLCVIHDLADLSHEDELATDIVVSGHTHGEPVCELREGRLYLNPGECCGWLTGRARASILDTEAMRAQTLVLLEQERPRG